MVPAATRRTRPGTAERMPEVEPVTEPVPGLRRKLLSRLSENLSLEFEDAVELAVRLRRLELGCARLVPRGSLPVGQTGAVGRATRPMNLPALLSQHGCLAH